MVTLWLTVTLPASTVQTPLTVSDAYAAAGDGPARARIAGRSACTQCGCPQRRDRQHQRAGKRQAADSDPSHRWFLLELRDLVRWVQFRAYHGPCAMSRQGSNIVSGKDYGAPARTRRPPIRRPEDPLAVARCPLPRIWTPSYAHLRGPAATRGLALTARSSAHAAKVSGTKMERETRLELATLCLGSRCSTTELLPLETLRQILA